MQPEGQAEVLSPRSRNARRSLAFPFFPLGSSHDSRYNFAPAGITVQTKPTGSFRHDQTKNTQVDQETLSPDGNWQGQASQVRNEPLGDQQAFEEDSSVARHPSARAEHDPRDRRCLARQQLLTAFFQAPGLWVLTIASFPSGRREVCSRAERPIAVT